MRWGRCSPPGPSLSAGPVSGRWCLVPCRILLCSLQLAVSEPWNGGTSSSVPDTPFPSRLVIVPITGRGRSPQVSCLPLAPSTWDPVSGSPRAVWASPDPLPRQQRPAVLVAVSVPPLPCCTARGPVWGGDRAHGRATVTASGTVGSPWGTSAAERAGRRGSGSSSVLLGCPFKSFSPTAERAVGGTWAALCTNHEPGARSLSLIGSRPSRPVALGTGREGPRRGGLGRRLSPGSLDGGALGAGTSLGPVPEVPWGPRQGGVRHGRSCPPPSSTAGPGCTQGRSGGPGCCPPTGTETPAELRCLLLPGARPGPPSWSNALA